MHINEIIQLISLIIVSLIAVVCDIRSQRIPNMLTLPAMALAVIYHSVLNGFQGFLFSMGGLAVGIAVLIIPYLMGGMGAGDAKFMGAVGGLLGPTGVFAAFLLTALAGGIYALVILARNGSLKETFYRYLVTLKTFLVEGKFIYLPPAERERALRLKYGIAIAAGSVSSFFMGHMLWGIL